MPTMIMNAAPRPALDVAAGMAEPSSAPAGEGARPVAEGRGAAPGDVFSRLLTVYLADSGPIDGDTPAAGPGQTGGPGGEDDPGLPLPGTGMTLPPGLPLAQDAEPVPSGAAGALAGATAVMRPGDRAPGGQADPLPAVLSGPRPAPVRGDHPTIHYAPSPDAGRGDALLQPLTVGPAPAFSREGGTPQPALMLQNALAAQGQSPDELLAALSSASDPRPLHPFPAAPMTVAVPQDGGSGVTDRPPVSLALNSPFNHAEWRDEIGHRIRWMVGNHLQAAELKINPPQLGPVEVRISVQNDHMNVLFTTHHAVVRDALEEAVPRLRELMGGSGFDSVDVDVSQHSSPEERGGSALPDPMPAAGTAGEDPDLGLPGEAPRPIRPALGAVDYYV